MRCRPSEDRFHVGGFVLHLPMGEAERGQAGGGVFLEAQRVAGLGGRSAVVAPAVGLDHEAKVGPEEVDLEFVDLDFGERRGESGGCGDGAEEEFQFVVGEAEGVLVEDRSERTDAGLARVVVEGLAQGIGIDDVSLVRLVDRALEGLRPRGRRQVEKRLNWLGKGMFWRVVMASAGKVGRRWQRTPGRRDSESRLTLTSM